MNFLAILFGHFRKTSVLIFLSTLASAIFNIICLVSLNSALVQDRIHTTPFYLTIFTTSLVLFVFTKRYSLFKSTVLVEQYVKQLRLKISEKMRMSHLDSLERVGLARIISVFTEDTQIISSTSPLIINSLTNIFILLFSLSYLWVLSEKAFYLYILFFLINSIYFTLTYSLFKNETERYKIQREKVLQLLQHHLNGVKELKLHPKNYLKLFNGSFKRENEENRKLKISLNEISMENRLAGQIFVYGHLCIVIFIGPLYFDLPSGIIIKLATLSFFMMGPMEFLLQTFPYLLDSTLALQQIFKLNQDLDSLPKTNFIVSSSQVKSDLTTNFSNILLNQVEYKYFLTNSGRSFQIGPLNFQLNKGEIVFITGGNGQGKSTFLKVLSGLYPASDGTIKVKAADQSQVVNESSLNHYSQLFAAIFTDFHLFERPYGLESEEKRPDKIQEELALMKLERKTSLVDDKWINLQLSTGQRKRLALIIAKLENKPILLFDEWAADQDPQFRQFFYEVLIKDLQQSGKTLVIATHDDRYYHLADRIVTMENGKFV